MFHTHTHTHTHTVVQGHLPYIPNMTVRNKNLTVHCLQDYQKATAMPCMLPALVVYNLFNLCPLDCW